MINKHIVFVSYELHPINAGGCGVFIWHAINELLKDENLRISLLLDMPKHECEMFLNNYLCQIPNGHNLRIFCLSEIIANKKMNLDIDDFNNLYLWKSYSFYQGLLEVNKQMHIDYIEFFDYVGVGYYTVRAHKYENVFPDTIMGIRAHCTIDLMDIQQNQHDLSEEKIIMYNMEKQTLKDTDIVLVPTIKWKYLYISRYGVEENKVVISEPPMKDEECVLYNKANINEKGILFYGRLFELKGVDDFVEAALIYLEKNKDQKVTFYMVGYEGRHSDGISYKEYLLRRIPNEYKQKFVFTGLLKREELYKIIKKVRFAVFPNYVESFCYAIHEIYELGIPILCRPIEAFQEYFHDGENCIYFDGSIISLYEKIAYLMKDNKILEKISYPYRVRKSENILGVYNEFLEKYQKNIQNNKEIIGTKNNSNKVSLIMFETEGSKTDNIIDINNFSFIDINKSYKLKLAEPNNYYCVEVLGQKYKVSSLGNSIDSRLLIHNQVIIINTPCTLNENDMLKLINALNSNTELQFVAIPLKDNITNRVYGLDLDMISKIKWLKSNYMINGIVKTNKRSLIDLFDRRLKSLGDKEILFSCGYVLFDTINKTNFKELNMVKSNYALLIHKSTKNIEWIPENLMKAIHNNQFGNRNVNELQYINHKLDVKINSNLSIKNRIMRFIINKIYSYLKYN